MRGPRQIATIAAVATLAVAMLVVVPRVGSAQLSGPSAPASDPVVAPTAAAPVGPTQNNATAGIRSHVSEQNLTREQAAANAGHSLTKPAILMIVGGAAFVAGLIIGGTGGTIVAIAGALVAIYGLYLFLQ